MQLPGFSLSIWDKTNRVDRVKRRTNSWINFALRFNRKHPALGVRTENIVTLDAFATVLIPCCPPFFTILHLFVWTPCLLAVSP
jgi:hypothetical protein